ncbi:MAG: DUF5995 family protein [Ilumatobacteraceae bacterium]
MGRAPAGVMLFVLVIVGCSGDDDGDRLGLAAGGREWPTTVAPSTTPACVSGDVTCVDETLGEMRRRLDLLASSCDHHAVFALTYLHITAGYREMNTDPGAFEDVVFMSHLDSLFGQFYFAAFDAYSSGDIESVPPAWRIAFDQSAAGEISGIGDALLGISAHINRDLPFVLAQLGIVDPSGRTRRDDFDRVNTVFGGALLAVLKEGAQRFDPALAQPKIGGQPLDAANALALVRQWRDAAFHNAERLSATVTPEARRAVVAEIEDNAAVMARSLQLATALSPSESSAARDDYCESRLN